MDEMTEIDRAHAAMEAASGDEGARLRFYERLAGTELFLLLKAEAQGNEVMPEVFEITDASFVLAFDREARLAAFTGTVAPYAALSGRALCDLLAQRSLGLALNPEVAPSSFVLPPEGVAWLAETLRQGPDEVENAIARVFAPHGIPESLLSQLDSRLATAQGLAEAAYLVGVKYDSGASGHLLGIVDALPGAEPALARAVSEVLRFSGLEAAILDVTFLAASDPVAARLARVGLRFDLPKAPAGQATRPAPGSDPDAPPILR